MKKLIIIWAILIAIYNTPVYDGAFINGQSRLEPETSPTKTIYDIKNWDHPANKVFEESDYTYGKLTKVELYDNNTYPVFYLEIAYWDSFIDELNRKDFYGLINEVAKANGYWSYEIKDTGNRIDIKVTCDRKGKTISDCKINGYSSLKEFMLSEIDEKFNEYLKLLPLDKAREKLLCSGDLTGDGIDEGILTYEDELYLVSTYNGKAFKNLGRLVDNYSVGHVYNGADIRSLDRTGKKYIVVNIAHDAAPASGYFIYDYDGYLPQCIMVNFPGATAYGRCELNDYDKDGIDDNIRYYDYIDVEQHSVIEYSSFLSDIAKSELKYGNESGKFFYPSTPEDVIRAYVEATCMVKEAEHERDYFLSDKKIKSIKLEFNVNTSTYMEIQLDISKVRESRNKIVYEVSEELFDGTVKTRFHMRNYDEKWKIEAIEIR